MIPIKLLVLYQGKERAVISYGAHTLRHLRVKLEKVLGIPYQNQVLVHGISSDQTVLINNEPFKDNSTLNDLKISEGANIILDKVDLKNGKKTDSEGNVQINSNLVSVLISRDDEHGVNRICINK